MFRKVLLTLDGVLADVSRRSASTSFYPHFSFRRLVGEWPRRLLTPPLCAPFETRLSNEDLALLLCACPRPRLERWLRNTLELITQTFGRW